MFSLPTQGLQLFKALSKKKENKPKHQETQIRVCPVKIDTETSF
jgi:hypothetical protein